MSSSHNSTTTGGHEVARFFMDGGKAGGNVVRTFASGSKIVRGKALSNPVYY
jgi:hypothetical protein